MKVFAIETQGETDWVNADDILGCLKFYIKETGVNISDIDSIDELSDEELGILQVHYPVEDSEPPKTFREAIAELATSEIFASTAYN